MATELQLLWSALAFYALAGSAAIGATVLAKRLDRAILAMIVTGLAAHALSNIPVVLLGTLFLSKEGLSMEKVSGMGDEPQGEGR